MQQQKDTPQAQDFIGNLDQAEVLPQADGARTLVVRGWLVHAAQPITSVQIGVLSDKIMTTTPAPRPDVANALGLKQQERVFGFSAELPLRGEWSLPLPLLLLIKLQNGETVTSTFSVLGNNTCEALDLLAPIAAPLNTAPVNPPSADDPAPVVNIDFFGEEERQQMLLEVIERQNSLVGVFQAAGCSPEASVTEAEKLLTNCREIPRVSILDRFETTNVPSFPPLPSNALSLQNTAKSVCIVCSADSLALTASPSLVLADFLKEMGHAVTIAYCAQTADLLTQLPESCASAALFAMAAKGITCIEIPGAPVELAGDPAAIRSYQVFLWLEKQLFDWVHFEDTGGLGYYAALAKRAGLALSNSAICTGIYRPSSLDRESARRLPCDVAEIRRDYLERRTIELSDAAYCGSQTMLAWLTERGWEFPHNTYHLGDPLALARCLPGIAESGLLNAITNAAAESGAKPPRVSICLLHRDNPELLERCLTSIATQDYPELEVIIADNASVEQASLDYLCSIAGNYPQLNPMVLCRTKESRGAARNVAALHASGELLLCIDQDQVLMPNAVSTFVEAARRMRADVLTSILDRLPQISGTPQLQMQRQRLIPTGGPSSAGAFQNCFGEGAAFMRREIFLAVGGFSEDLDTTAELWELLAECSLRGYRLEVVPKAVVQNCLTGEETAGQSYAQSAQILRPYLHAAPHTLRELILLARGMALAPAENSNAEAAAEARPAADASHAEFGGGPQAPLLESQIEVRRLERGSEEVQLPVSRIEEVLRLADGNASSRN